MKPRLITTNYLYLHCCFAHIIPRVALSPCHPLPQPNCHPRSRTLFRADRRSEGNKRTKGSASASSKQGVPVPRVRRIELLLLLLLRAGVPSCNITDKKWTRFDLHKLLPFKNSTDKTTPTAGVIEFHWTHLRRRNAQERRRPRPVCLQATPTCPLRCFSRASGVERIFKNRKTRKWHFPKFRSPTRTPATKKADRLGQYGGTGKGYSP